MAFVPFPNVAEVFFDFTGPDAEQCGWVMHFRNQGTISRDEMNDLGAALASWFDTDMQTLMTAGYTLNQITLRDLTVQSSWVVEWVGILPLTGSLAGNSLPSNVAWSVKKVTGYAGRSYRGRIYHMGLGEAQVSGNFVDAAYAADVIDAYNALLPLVDGTGSGWEMVVASKFSNGAPRVTGLATVVTGLVSVDLVVDTQRRRLPRT